MLDRCSAGPLLGLEGLTITATGECGGRSCESHADTDRCAEGLSPCRAPESVEFDPCTLLDEKTFSPIRRHGATGATVVVAPTRSRQREEFEDVGAADPSSSPNSRGIRLTDSNKPWHQKMDMTPPKSEEVPVCTDIDLDDMDCGNLPSDGVVRRIEELEGALEDLKRCKDKVVAELRSLLEQTTSIALGEFELTETREKVERLEGTILEQAAQIMALSSQLARELDTLNDSYAEEERLDNFEGAPSREFDLDSAEIWQPPEKLKAYLTTEQIEGLFPMPTSEPCTPDSKVPTESYLSPGDAKVLEEFYGPGVLAGLSHRLLSPRSRNQQGEPESGRLFAETCKSPNATSSPRDSKPLELHFKEALGESITSQGAGRTFSGHYSAGHYSDVVELFDDLSMEDAGVPSFSRSGKWLADSASPTSSGQPGALRQEHDDMPVFDDYSYRNSSGSEGFGLSAGLDNSKYANMAADLTSLGQPSHKLERCETDPGSSSTDSRSRRGTSSPSSAKVKRQMGSRTPMSLGAKACRHGSRIADSADDGCTQQAPFWTLVKQPPQRRSATCEVLQGCTPVDIASANLGADTCILNQDVDAHGLEVPDRDLVSVHLTTREQRLELRDFLCEMVATKKAASMFLLYDVEAEPPKYARPPASSRSEPLVSEPAARSPNPSALPPGLPSRSDSPVTAIATALVESPRYESPGAAMASAEATEAEPPASKPSTADFFLSSDQDAGQPGYLACEPAYPVAARHGMRCRVPATSRTSLTDLAEAWTEFQQASAPASASASRSEQVPASSRSSGEPAVPAEFAEGPRSSGSTWREEPTKADAGRCTSPSNLEFKGRATWHVAGLAPAASSMNGKTRSPRHGRLPYARHRQADKPEDMVTQPEDKAKSVSVRAAAPSGRRDVTGPAPRSVSWEEELVKPMADRSDDEVEPPSDDEDPEEGAPEVPQSVPACPPQQTSKPPHDPHQLTFAERRQMFSSSVASPLESDSQANKGRLGESSARLPSALPATCTRLRDHEPDYVVMEC